MWRSFVVYDGNGRGEVIAMGESNEVIMVGVREYEEDLPVMLKLENDKAVIEALNESGWRCTQVDLLDLLKWVSENKPEVYMRFVTVSMMARGTGS